MDCLQEKLRKMEEESKSPSLAGANKTSRYWLNQFIRSLPFSGRDVERIPGRRGFFEIADSYIRLLKEALIKDPISKSNRPHHFKEPERLMKVNVHGQSLEVTLKTDGFGRFDFRAQTPEGQYISDGSYRSFGGSFGQKPRESYAKKIKKLLDKMGLVRIESFREEIEWREACGIHTFLYYIANRTRMNKSSQSEDVSYHSLPQEAGLECIEKEAVDFTAKAIGSRAFYSVYHASKGYDAQQRVRDKYLRQDTYSPAVIQAAKAEFQKASEECLASAPSVDLR